MEDSIRKIYDVYDKVSIYVAKKSSKFKKDKIRELISNIYTPGPSYQFVFNIAELKIDFVSESVRDILGIEPVDFSPQRFFEHIHPEDREYYGYREETTAKFLYTTIERSEIQYYKVSYQFRCKGKNGYKLMLHQVVAIEFDEHGNLMKTFGSHSDISHLSTINNKKISFIGLDGRPSYFNLDSLDELKNYHSTQAPYSVRETEILRLISEGHSAGQISLVLGITEETVRTHRKNILSKSHCKNTVEAVSAAIRGGLI